MNSAVKAGVHSVKSLTEGHSDARPRELQEDIQLLQPGENYTILILRCNSPVQIESIPSNPADQVEGLQVV